MFSSGERGVLRGLNNEGFEQQTKRTGCQTSSVLRAIPLPASIFVRNGDEGTISRERTRASFWKHLCEQRSLSSGLFHQNGSLLTNDKRTCVTKVKRKRVGAVSVDSGRYSIIRIRAPIAGKSPLRFIHGRYLCFGGGTQVWSKRFFVRGGALYRPKKESKEGSSKRFGVYST